MDKYEYKLKLEELKNLVAEERYEEAAAIADGINWKKVRNVNTLVMVGDIYSRLNRYDACKSVLLQAYDHSPIGRNIVSRLAQAAVSARRLADAEEYYNEFLEIAPTDSRRYVIAYQISCLKDAPLTDRIAILEEFKEKEYTEMWGYELAALYAQAGMRDKCVESCDELVLWFGEGEYVEKALDMKRRFQPLTLAQEEKYRKLHEKRQAVEIHIPAKDAADFKEPEGAQVKTVTASKFNTLNLQEEIARGMQQIMDATKEETVTDTMESIKKIVSDIPYLNGGQEEEKQSPFFDKSSINEEIDRTIMEDFNGLLSEEEDGQMSLQMPEDSETEPQVAGQMSIEEVLAEWEKTKRAAEAAIEAAEHKKLEMSKSQALAEAGEIMERLKALIPLLTAGAAEGLSAEEAPIAATLVPTAEEKEAMARAAEEEALAAAAEAARQETMQKAALEAEKPEAEEELTETVSGDFNEQPQPETEEEPAMEPAEEIPDEVPQPEEREPAVSADAPTKEMPDLAEAAAIAGLAGSDFAAPGKTADEPQAQTDREEPAKGTADADSAEDAELQRILAQSSRMFTEGTQKKVPESPYADSVITMNTSTLPEIPKPEELVKDDPVAFTGTLTQEQREMFSYFLPVPGMEEQICQILTGANQRIGNSVTSLSGNIIIQGEEGSGKTVLATSLIKAIQKIVGNERAKIGKISADSLNRKDFAALVPRMAGGYLIVDKAGELTAATAARMSRVMEQNTKGLVVILEDTRAGIKKAMSLDFGFAKKFTEKINIPIFTIDELVDFGKAYAEEMECTIEEMGVLALYNRINNIQKLDRATTLAEVKAIVDQAISNAEGKAFGGLFNKKYDENDYLILREKDFEH